MTTPNKPAENPALAYNQHPSPSYSVFTEYLDLANDNVGGLALECSDDFFAEKENLLKSSIPVFLIDKYTDNGKWMDGWESRRKRVPGYDWCVVKLGAPGKILGVNIDTSFFTGNFPEYASIEACEAPEVSSAEKLKSLRPQWVEILPKSKLLGGTQNLFQVNAPERATYLRLNIFPDGGVARLRVHGIPKPVLKKEAQDMACVTQGGRVITSSDSYFGQKDNLILPGKSKNMGGGWETRRRRGPGFDWIIVQLGAETKVSSIEADTHFYKGNFPDRCSIDACRITDKQMLACDFRDRTDIQWTQLLGETKMKADSNHVFKGDLQNLSQPYTHIRLNIFPDGGISRLRVLGTPV